MDANQNHSQKIHLKKLSKQVIVITGASSGIGLATAVMAAKRGARVVLSSRNKSELDRICREIAADGGTAIAVECDVSDADAVQRLADQAIAEFGAIDTWVNNAGLSIYGKLTEVPLNEKRKLFEINFWGVVYGCRSAIRAMRESGGAIINIGSVLSERAIPIQGMYSASKHAVKAYTDALRMELEAEGYPISVTLIKPGAIDTPFTQHGVNHMEHNPVHVAPVYAPEVVAKAILECCEHPKRDVFIGGSAKFFSLMETFLPRLADVFMEKHLMEDGQSSRQADLRRQEPALYSAPRREGEIRGNYPGRVKRTSAYTSASMHPAKAAFTAIGLGLAAAAGIGYLQQQQGQQRQRRTGMNEEASQSPIANFVPAETLRH